MLRCGGLDTVEGLVKTVDVFDKSISGGGWGGQGGFNILKCALQGTHEETLCVPGRNIPFYAYYIDDIFNYPLHSRELIEHYFAFPLNITDLRRPSVRTTGEMSSRRHMRRVLCYSHKTNSATTACVNRWWYA
jgi:hypothetical protein